MGDASEPQPHGLFTYRIPDNSITPEERALFAQPKYTDLVTESLPLHDFNSDPNIVKGAAGLDAQGFTYIKHKSALADGDRWFEGDNLEEIYQAEVAALVCKVTGAKRAVVNNMAARRRFVERQKDPNAIFRRDDPLAKVMDALPKDRCLVMGKDASKSLEPVRAAHIDYTIKGLRDTVRHCRKDMADAGRDFLSAEDAQNANQNHEATTSKPRVAAYSIWRPVKTITRDPLSVCHWDSFDKSDRLPIEYRATSETREGGDYVLQAWVIGPPKDASLHRWYWVPQQTPEDVLFIKLADTEAEYNSDVADGVPHLSPMIEGLADDLPPRESLEARVLAFW